MRGSAVAPWKLAAALMREGTAAAFQTVNGPPMQ